MNEEQAERLIALVASQYSADVDIQAQTHNLLQVHLLEAWLLKLILFVAVFGGVVVIGLLRPRGTR